MSRKDENSVIEIVTIVSSERRACSDVLIALLVAVMNAEDWLLAILGEAENARAFLAFAVLAFLRY